MAKYINADCRLCRREGTKLFLKGERCTSKKCAMEKRVGVPGMHPNSKKKPSEYLIQLREKQKVKRAYGLLEKQFHGYYEEAARMKGKTGEVMLSLLERRLDNVVYRLGLGASRAMARQIVNHTHIEVNGKVVNIPSYSVKPGQVVGVREKSKSLEVVETSLAGRNHSQYPWIEWDAQTKSGKFLHKPERADIPENIKEQLIVELYSK